MTRSASLVISLLVAGSWCGAGYAGEIRGHVIITQGLTKKRVTLPTYQLRGTAVKLPSESLPAIDELGRVAVYLEGSGLSTGTPVSLEMKQLEREFAPDIVVVPIGSTISFPNGDPIFHNVFSLSKPKQFDLGFYPAGQTRKVRFDKAGMVQVYCHLHANMNAVILVVPSAWYGRLGPDGNVVLSGVPAGSYDIVGWHKSAGFLRQHIRVPETGSVEVEMLIPMVDPKRE